MIAGMIALVGPPGSGKTTVGGALATRLGTGFRDLDAEVAARFGEVADIVLEGGAAALTAREVEVLGDLVREPGVGVIAVGSAALDDGAGLAALEGATVVYLDADLAHTFPRSGMNTPQPRGLVNPRQLWARMLRERDAVYRGAADHVVTVGDLDVEGVVDALAGVLPPVR